MRTKIVIALLLVIGASFYLVAATTIRLVGDSLFEQTIRQEMTSVTELSGTLGDHTLGCQEEDISYIWQNAYHPRTRTVDMRLSIFVGDTDGRYQRLEETQTQRAHTLEELTKYLAEAGFADIRAYGKLALRAPRPGDERWHIRAIRPKENAK